MAEQVTWSREAVEDLQSIAEYIERDSPRYAAAVVDRIISLAREIPSHPRLGRVVPEIGREDVRERFAYSYRLIYLLRIDTIVVVNVIHGRRSYDGASADLS